MEKYLIFCDVSGDIDESLAASSDLHFIPMEYSIGNEMRTCGGDRPEAEMKAFYDAQRNGDLTKTSQVTPQGYQDMMSPYMADGWSIICICLSSGLSSTYQSACLAQMNLKDKYPDVDFLPVDSLAASGGLGILCERALRNREAGMSLKDNFDDVQATAHKLRHWFLVQDLDYLKRGGRVSAATAAVGSLLNIKPILQIDPEGKLTTEYKERGYKAAARRIVRLFAETCDPDSGEAVYVIHSDAPEVAAQLRAEAEAIFPNMTFRTHMLTPIIGAHTGPNLAALIYVGK